jgi:DNA-binding NarL/FixJ family response regulator
MQTPIEVAILSEDRMLREVLTVLLAGCTGLRVAATEADPAVVAQEGSQTRIDVVLIDTGYDPRGALGRVRAARDRWPEAKTVVLGLDHEDESVADYVEAGAHAYVLQSASPEGLVTVIREVQEGRSPCAPQVVTAVLRRIASLAKFPVTPPPAVEPLTPREREILALMACGLGNKEVCHRLHITVQTVKNHVHSILAKLQVRRRREAVRLAFELGLLAEPGEGGRGSAVVR